MDLVTTCGFQVLILIRQIRNKMERWTLTLIILLFLHMPVAVCFFFPARIAYLWDKTSDSAEDYLGGYHIIECRMGKQVSIAYALRDPTFPCSCKPWCEDYGVCCTDRAQGRINLTFSETGCLGDGTYAMIRCPASWGEGDVREACETGRGKYTRDEPVTDLDTGVKYRNEFCARCHGVESYAKWPLNVTCQHSNGVYKAESLEEFVELAQNVRSGCQVFRMPPTPEDITGRCAGEQWLTTTPVSTCNVTGFWAASSYDEDVQRNCQKYKGPVLRLRANDRIYQNLFCAICNGYRPIVDNMRVDFRNPDPINPSPNGPLSLLLGFDTPEEDVEPDQLDLCSPGQWLDRNNECRNLTCTPGKLLNNTCSTVVSQIRGLVYSLNFTLLPDNNTIESSIETEELKAQFSDEIFSALNVKLENTSRRCILDAVLTFEKVPEYPGMFMVHSVKVTGDLTAFRDIDRDEIEGTLVERLFKSEWNITLGEQNITFRYTYLLHSITENKDLSLIETEKTSFSIEDPLDITYSIIPHSLFVPLSPLLVCPYAEFNASEYEMRQNENNATEVVLKFGEENVALPEMDKLEEEGDLLRVCLESLEAMPRRESEQVVVELTWQYILSMVVFPLSILCLILTLIVYLLLPVLHTQPGLNTMGTCMALLVAQMALLLASHRVTSGPSCQALGMLVHLSWLSMFCWMSVCSLHMFHLFSAKTYRGSSSERYKNLARNVLLTILLPSLVVALVVGLSHLTSGGQSIGYSDFSCYLESALLVGVAMVLPLGLMLIVNLALFIATVRRINEVTKLQARAETEGDFRQHLHVCVRLSVLTGATWVLSLLAEGLAIDWLRVVSILANGGQGVMLFLSYVVCRRVANLLAVKFGLKEIEVSSSRSGHTATTDTKHASPTKDKTQTNSIEATD